VVLIALYAARALFNPTHLWLTRRWALVIGAFHQQLWLENTWHGTPPKGLGNSMTAKSYDASAG
jgi:hypothetical protein